MASRAEKPALYSKLTAGLRSQPIIIEDVYPELDCGRFPIKREVGDALTVRATIFKEGHGRIAAVLCIRRKDRKAWREIPMTLVEPGLDRWEATVRLDENTRYVYGIEAWADEFETWRDEIEKKRDAGQAVKLELLEGRAIVAATAARAGGADRKLLEETLGGLERSNDEAVQFELLMAAQLKEVMARLPDRSGAVRYPHELEVVVDRIQARFAAWYEMFPRSQGTDPGRGATFKECIARLDDIGAMGFDVIYLVPIHPVGRANRKGPNNALPAGPDHPGSPYAIGAAEGGHAAVHPELGTIEDFRAFVSAARERGMEVALDFAIQCSPDHPWLKEHPEWFEFRPDGTLKHAENPPKKYQDIVNVNFYGPHRDALWRALRDIIDFWIANGVRIFRVDNPHTKPVQFWEWLIGEVQERHPDVLFLSEAFTRPPMLKMLAKAGFSQSYTYFTWRTFKQELTDYLTELTRTEVSEYLRPNLFTNTPDILPPFLQTGGRPAFQIRLVLAATLSSLYGIYNSFELCEARAVPGTEEYLNSEKYEYKVWDWERPGNIKGYIAAVNAIRRRNPALHHFRNLRFYRASNENVLFYGKMTQDRTNMVFVAVNLDPFEAHETELELPLETMGIGDEGPYEVEELLTGIRHLWRGRVQRVRLTPQESPAQIYRVQALEHVDFHQPSL